MSHQGLSRKCFFRDKLFFWICALSVSRFGILIVRKFVTLPLILINLDIQTQFSMELWASLLQSNSQSKALSVQWTIWFRFVFVTAGVGIVMDRKIHEKILMLIYFDYNLKFLHMSRLGFLNQGFNWEHYLCRRGCVMKDFFPSWHGQPDGRQFPQNAVG